MCSNPYESADEDTLAEILREAESRLSAQLQAAIAADQRALTYSGLLVAAVGAMIGLATNSARPIVQLVVIATVLALAAVAALWSARPTRWGFVGTDPYEWQADLLDPAKTLHRSKAERVAHYGDALTRNSRSMRRAAWAMRLSLVLTAVALGAAIVWTWIKALA